MTNTAANGSVSSRRMEARGSTKSSMPATHDAISTASMTPIGTRSAASRAASRRAGDRACIDGAEPRTDHRGDADDAKKRRSRSRVMAESAAVIGPGL